MKSALLSSFQLKTVSLKGGCCGAFFYHHFQQYFSYIVAVRFIGGGNQSTLRKPQTFRKSLTNFTTYKHCIEYTSP